MPSIIHIDGNSEESTLHSLDEYLLGPVRALVQPVVNLLRKLLLQRSRHLEIGKVYRSALNPPLLSNKNDYVAR